MASVALIFRDRISSFRATQENFARIQDQKEVRSEKLRKIKQKENEEVRRNRNFRKGGKEYVKKFLFILKRYVIMRNIENKTEKLRHLDVRRHEKRNTKILVLQKDTWDTKKKKKNVF